MNIVYIALGSNLENPLQKVTSAVAEIATLGNVRAQSPWYRSKAIGPGMQDDYINGVLCLETELEALTLLARLQAIEDRHGRLRTIRWGARTLDLDILLFNQCVINTDQLVVPHPRMTERNFVICPLSDIAPDLLLANNQTTRETCKALSKQGLEKLEQNR